MNNPSQELCGSWWSHGDWVDAKCTFDTHILDLNPAQHNVSTRFIPAPVDLHVHGCGGYDCMQGEPALRAMLRAALKTGTSALLATSVTAPFDNISEFIDSAKNVINNPDNGAALLLGVHLEGPFINPDKLGAQPPHTAKPDLDIVRSWLSSGIVKVMTIAPEVDEDGQLMQLLLQHNVKVQIGHSNCTWHQAQLALNNGCGVTHLYNAMGGVSHRDGGTATAALAYADFAEIITDGIHVERAAFDIALKAIPNLYSVTDATAAAGMPDGNFILGSLSVYKKGDRVQLVDGTIAGSCLTQVQSLALLRSWNLDWPTIIELTSSRPASWINETTLGKITIGAKANWIELNADTAVALWVEGQRHALDSSTILDKTSTPT